LASRATLQVYYKATSEKVGAPALGKHPSHARRFCRGGPMSNFPEQPEKLGMWNILVHIAVRTEIYVGLLLLGMAAYGVVLL